ncbi:GntR family transcriptional regulator [Agromyces sp. CFH 90414]|uniref:GntR family transcriptional regulator n=1 Tax=Agromyces agglutinans TaxID=2662258 RepID=A0A6I2F584_9MICO|nr:GntR family transcriptional regulator [Agromyces agglutinans]MRG59759.1 GntR family transcriptional regulator [Agromyces agglutinans]
MTGFAFRISGEASVPPFEQLRAQVVEGVREGRLTAGERLPTVRALADELGLAANTVAKAYRELEQDGVIETRGRSGTFIAAHGDAAHRSVQEAAAEYAALARRLRVPADDALAIVDAALRIGT